MFVILCVFHSHKFLFSPVILFLFHLTWDFFFSISQIQSLPFCLWIFIISNADLNFLHFNFPYLISFSDTFLSYLLHIHLTSIECAVLSSYLQKLLYHQVYIFLNCFWNTIYLFFLEITSCKVYIFLKSIICLNSKMFLCFEKTLLTCALLCFVLFSMYS